MYIQQSRNIVLKHIKFKYKPTCFLLVSKKTKQNRCKVVGPSQLLGLDT